MHLADEIVKFRSVAVAGLAKNVGKTVTLNYLIREAHKKSYRIGVTSIGIDGESTDQVTRTAKPEIRLFSGMLFATSEVHYRKRLIESEVVGIAPRSTSMGRVVVSRAIGDGKVLLAGPPDTFSLKRLIDDMASRDIETVLVDGALSRVSLASPAVTDAMILATGAALSPDIGKIVARTVFVCTLMELPEVTGELKGKLEHLDTGMWGFDREDNPVRLEVRSSLDYQAVKEGILKFGPKIYVSGIVTDRLLQFLSTQKNTVTPRLIVRDFTKLFVEPRTLRFFLNRGGSIELMRRSRLLAVTINPWSPAGYNVDKDLLQESLQKELNVPVIYIDPEYEKNMTE